MRESSFSFELRPQRTVAGVQLIDFGESFGPADQATAFAQSWIMSEKDTTITFGSSSANAIKIWINDDLVLSRAASRELAVAEVAYNLFDFQDTFSAKLNAGANRILIQSNASPEQWTVLLRPVTPHGMLETSIYFSNTRRRGEKSRESAWAILGPVPTGFEDSEKSAPPQANSETPFWEIGDKRHAWQAPVLSFLPRLTVNQENSYKRESYLEWHYSHGALMLTLLHLADLNGDKTYSKFVERVVDFALTNRDYFEGQYRKKHALRGSYHRLFRRTMLDDTGAAALAVVELAIRKQRSDLREFVGPIGDYVLHKQQRLADGTFCRPEPMPRTVWADDLFMSVPFMLRMAQLTGNSAYAEDAVQQMLTFHRHLFDPETRLFHHGWFDQSSQNSTVFWGRANGWIVWAFSEALAVLPKSHSEYSKVLKIFQEHLRGLAAFQDDNGMWHQVLDHPESYEESSCTAMFVLGMARGVRNGWLDESFTAVALKGWQALTGKIAADGTVHGICRGTGMGEDLQFYLDRPTFDHDPRGLGAVVTAGIEVAKLTAK